ncbi:MAG: hypothetical protein VYE69_25295, partial [Pseudomonadota bacterium]|nr:hypothetical protein [Pseudomonadota bacterium]
MIIEQITARSPARHNHAPSTFPAALTHSDNLTDSNAYGRTLSIVAHDLRGPLANLSLLIE